MKTVILCLVLAGTLSSQAAVKPHALFSKGAVLQQGVEVPIWGTANDGENVTVKFQGQEVSTVTKDGRWLVKFKPLKPGGPFTMTIAGEKTVEVEDLLVGEVWLCGGQSNMHFPLRNATNSAVAIAAANDPLLRVLTVTPDPQAEPQRDLRASWLVSHPTNAPSFTAIGYFFGRELRKTLNVPVGLIHSSRGGTSAQQWTRAKTLRDNPAFSEFFKTEKPESGPGCFYNGMIAPLVPYAIRGVILYQGGGNSSYPQQYQTLFPTLIKDWRMAWGQGDFPFLFVQMTPLQTMRPEFREAQLVAWQNTTNTAMVVTTDCGDAQETHPKQKEPVGRRLALAARALAYGEKIEYSGPVYQSMKVDDDHVVLNFQHTGTGLVAKDGDLKGFTIAGANKTFTNATAKLDGAQVIVSSPVVPQPVAVRYGWSNVPDVNLYNKEGLPASPFRTDFP